MKIRSGAIAAMYVYPQKKVQGAESLFRNRLH